MVLYKMTCDIINLPKIHRNLYLGSAKAARTCAPSHMQILCVANGSTCDSCRGELCTGSFSNVPDDFFMSKRAFDSFTIPAAKKLEQALNKGPTLVHCYAGINRSCSVIAKYAMMYKKMTADEVIYYLREKNRRERHLPALSNFAFVSHLRCDTNYKTPWYAYIIWGFTLAVTLFYFPRRIPA